MRRSKPPRVASFVVVSFVIVVGAMAQETRPEPLGAGPPWRGPVRPTAANEVFATGNGCSMCHSAAPAATAMRSPTGDDISPHGLWQASLMANAFRDPYWRAQVAKESAADPEHAPATQALCIRCHAPMAHHTARLGGQPALTMAAIADDPLAADGVSCTVCHQIQPEGLGDSSTFGGMFSLKRGREIYGPYPDPAPGPMRMHSGYAPTHAEHVRSSGLCGSCHTLFTGHTGSAFPEQSPYLEWRNSAFQNEHDAGKDSRTCQQCHMPSQGPTRIARNPMGRDFVIAPRPDFAPHLFVGGNAFMLDLLRANRTQLGVTAPESALERAAAATRRQLQNDTVRLDVGDITRKDGRAEFSITVTNLTGHKFPTGYPARRAWLHVQVRSGREVLFESGAVDKDGSLVKVGDELSIPHKDTVEKPEDVVVYEMVAVDPSGKPTTYLSKMAKRAKDTRLLPKGWRPDATGIGDIAPVAIGDDSNFTGGADTVTVRVPIAEGTPKGLQAIVWLEYQSIPPAWVAALRSVDAAEPRTFVALYDAAQKQPETVAIATRSER